MKNFSFHFIAAFILLFFQQADAQTLIINEVSNGPSGNQEYVEFVVASNTAVYNCGNTTPPCLDIRGWIFDDNSGYHGSSGVASGAVRFSQNALWSCVPLGTIIVIYNNADPNPAMPADDLSLSDGNCRIVAPISSALFESNGTTPGAVACSYPPAGWTSGGSWNNTLLANAGDCARIVNLAGCEVFSVCWGSDNLNNVIYMSGAAGQKVYYFNSGNPALQSNWSTGSANPSPGLQTPGAANNAANASYIAQFNNNCMPITPISVTATSVNAGCTCTGSATATATGSIPGYTYTWYNAVYTPIGQTTATATGLCAGVYNVVATSSIGCMDTATVTITSTATTGVSVNSASVCAGGSATLTATPLVTGGTYLWAPGGQTTPSITVNPATTTNYTVTYTISGCAATATGTVTVTAIPTVTVNSPSICNGAAAALTAGGASSYTWSAGAASTGTNTATASPSATTTYTVTGTNAGCSSTAVSTVTVNAAPATTVNSPTICAGATATLTAGGAASYTWTAGATSTGTNTATASPSTTTTYTVTGTTTGCSSTAVATVTVIALPVVTVNSATICPGGTATLTANGATSYTWSAGATSTGVNTATATPAATTTYTVTGTSSGCSATAVATVTVNPLPVVTVNSPTICAGDAATLTAVGAASYTWSAGATSTGTNTATASPLTTITYTVTGTTSGCSSTAVATVTVNAVPATIVDSATVCTGGTATLTAGGATSYTWSAGATATGTNTASASPSGTTTTYTVTGTTSGCSSTAVALVTITPLPVVNVNSPTICAGDTAALTAGGAASYTWSAGASPTGTTTAAATPAATTTYTVTGTATGCSSTASATVTVTPLPVTTLNSPAICAGDTAILTAGGAANYSWSAGATVSGISTATATPAVTTTYTVTGTTAGCVSTAVSTVTVHTLPSLGISQTNANCFAACDGTATATGSGGALSYSYSWNTIPAQLTATATGLCAGIYTCTVTDTNSCSSSQTATIGQPAQVMITPLADAAICNPGSTIFNALVSGGSSSVYSYAWSPATGLSSTTVSNPTASPVTTTTYILNVSDGNGCIANPDTVIVTVNANITVIAAGSTVICSGNSANISATASNGSGTYSYSWSPATGLSNPSGSSTTATPASTTTYTVTASDGCSTPATDLVTITVLPTPVLSISADVTQGCVPLCVNFTGLASLSGTDTIHQWSWTYSDGGSAGIQNPSHCFTTAGTQDISLTAISVNGCSQTITANNMITAFQLPVAAFSNNLQDASLINPTIQFVNESVNANTYAWNFGDLQFSTQPDPEHEYYQPGTYQTTLIATSSNGCVDSITHEIIVHDIFTFYAPNAFTPDGNHLNDVFLPQGSGWKNYELTIFDRWGNVCFNTTDKLKGWDGVVKKGTERAQQDVYVWKVSLTDVYNEPHSYSGSVTIVK